MIDLLWAALIVRLLPPLKVAAVEEDTAVKVLVLDISLTVHVESAVEATEVVGEGGTGVTGISMDDGDGGD